VSRTSTFMTAHPTTLSSSVEHHTTLLVLK
jgi:hypothetical protein